MYYNGPFDMGGEVVVVGFGAAGAVAAMTASDEGREVLILEKQREDRRRPNSRFSGGLFICPSDVDAAEHYMRQLYRKNEDLFETDPAVIRTWAEETSSNLEWLRENGGSAIQVSDHGEHDAIEGYESISLYKPDMNEHPRTGHKGWGYGLFKFLLDEVESRPIRIVYQASAEWLLTNADGVVVGVSVIHKGRRRYVKASRAVVMTCGGFEFNDWMKLNYLRVHPTLFYGNPENTGDGVRMVQEVGGDLWHMNSCAARFVAHFEGSGYPGGTPVDFWGVTKRGVFVAGVEQYVKGDSRGDQGAPSPSVANIPVAQTYVDSSGTDLPGCIVTDRYGFRHTNEVYRAHVLYYELLNLDSHRLEYPKVPSWWIFDSRRVEMGRLTAEQFGPSGPLQEVPWSADNAPEIERGWIRSSDSIRGLADLCGMDSAVLSRTLSTYNAYCTAGEDPEFGRPSGTLTPLDRPPYYAVQLWPGGPNTQGGGRRDASARIMSVRGGVVPHLYSAGEFGSIYGMLYPSGGGNIGECLAFGRVAGRNAAAEVPV